MTDPQRVRDYLEKLSEQGVRPRLALPPFYRLLFRLGLRVRPPLSERFAVNALLQGSAFALLLGALVFVPAAAGDPRRLLVGILATLLAGSVFGVSTALYYRWKASRVQLPRW